MALWLLTSLRSYEGEGRLLARRRREKEIEQLSRCFRIHAVNLQAACHCVTSLIPVNVAALDAAFALLVLDVLHALRQEDAADFGLDFVPIMVPGIDSFAASAFGVKPRSLVSLNTQ
jgi:hypothetical protein